MKSLILALGLGLFAASLSAQAGSLYGASVSESAVKVRLVNAGAPSPVLIQVGAHTLKASASGEVTAYSPVAADLYLFSFLGKDYEFIPEVGTWYTIVATAKQLVIHADAAHTDPARAQIYFYNMCDSGAADLRSADGSVTVLPSIPALTGAQTAVNPVSISLAAYKNGKKAGGDLPVRFQRGSSYSVFVYDTPSGTRTFMAEAVIAKD